MSQARSLDLVHVAAVSYELLISGARSLKDKRAVVKPVVEGLRRRFSVSAAEVGHLDLRQRALVAVAAVSGTESHLCEVLDACDRFVWSSPELEVLSSERRWLDGEG